jgi:hypothetical protein
LKRLSASKLVFIAGVEGSGTTLLQEVINELPYAPAFGGAFYRLQVSEAAKRLNKITEALWAYPHRPQAEDKQTLIKQAREIGIPDSASHVVYKRSYPFKNRSYYPDLADIPLLSDDYKIVVLTRDLERNAKSILRRQFVPTMEEAIQRSQEGYELLKQQLEANPHLTVLSVRYEDLVDPNLTAQLLTQVEAFIGFTPGALVAHQKKIGKPTGG